MECQRSDEPLCFRQHFCGASILGGEGQNQLVCPFKREDWSWASRHRTRLSLRNSIKELTEVSNLNEGRQWPAIVNEIAVSFLRAFSLDISSSTCRRESYCVGASNAQRTDGVRAICDFTR
jgi:hypothetical protein